MSNIDKTEENLEVLTVLGINSQCIDMSWVFDSSTIFYPGSSESFKLCMSCSAPNEDYYAGGTFCSAEHGGTHLDGVCGLFRVPA